MSEGSPLFTVEVYDPEQQRHHRFQVPAHSYVLESAEQQGIRLPFACRNGACTTCAVKVTQGEIFQPEAMGLSRKLKAEGYALLCVSYACSDIQAITQAEDEVYELQFGRYFGRGKIKPGLLVEED